MAQASVYETHLHAHDLREVIRPVEYYPDYGLYRTDDQHLGFGFISPPLSGTDDSVTQRLNVLLTFDYPPGSFIQVMLLASQDIRETLEDIVALRGDVDPALRQSITNRLCLFQRASTQAPSPHIGAFVRNFNVIISIKIPIKNPDPTGHPSDEEIKRTSDLRISVEQTLKSAGLSPRNLDPEKFLRIIGSIFHWGPNARWRSAEPVWDAGRDINQQVSEADDMLEVDEKGLWLGQKRLRLLSPSRLPDAMTLWNMRRIIGDPLTGARGIHGNFFLNLNIFIPDNVEARAKIENDRNIITYQAFGQLIRFVPKIGKKKESFDALHEAMSDGDRIVQCMLTIGLFADDRDDSETRLSQAITYLREIGWQMKEDQYLVWPLFRNLLPFGGDATANRFLSRYNTLGSRHAVEFMPILGDWCGTGTPLLGFWARSGQIMSMDLFDSNTNYNTTIVAASGSGKSFLTCDIITSYISSGAQCWVIDVGRSYEKLCGAIKGDFLQFGENSGICLNPFPIVENYDEEADMLVGILVSMASMNDRLSDLQYARLRAVLKNLWEAHGKALTVDRVAEALIEEEDQRVSDVGHQMFAFTSAGEYGHYFVGANNVNFANNFTVLELEELKGRSHLQQVVLLILIYQVNQAMYLGDRGRRKVFIIDEAWDLLTKGDIASFIETGFRRFRKYNGAAITVTQSLNDLHGSKSGIAIAENSANMFLLYQKSETIESIKRTNRLVIGDAGYAYLKSVTTVTGYYSEIFFVTSYGMGVGRLVVDQYTKLLYSTHPDDIRNIMKRVNQGMNMAEAIGDILSQPD